MTLHRLVALVFTVLILIPFPASAQSQAPTPTPAAAPAGDQLLKAEELDALVAPIALYPDNLLSLVLMASTYPLEVVQADRWVKDNKKLKGDAQKAAVDKQSWDDSVKSLTATPDVLAMMSDKLDWTTKLGDAVLAQQPDIMDAIQRLRSRAEANNKLTTTTQQRVTKTQGQGGRQVIAIEPVNPETLYVPYYDPAVVYGGWPYPAYPPYYFGYPGYIGAGLIGAGLAFGAGWALGRWSSGGNYWGGGVSWNNNNININRPQVNPLGGNNWQHRPEHRQGVRYNNSNVRQKFGNNNIRGGAQNRMDFRGRGGNQVLKPGPGGGQRPGAGQRPSQRPSAGQRPSGGRPSAGQRPSGGRPSAGQRPSGGRAGQRPSGRPSAGQRPSGGRGGNALGSAGSGRAANLQSARGRASMGGRGGGGGFRGGGGGGARGGGGGGFRGGGGGGRGGGGGGRGGGGGGRRSDIALKHDIALLGHLPNGLGYYRFSYNGSDRAYVGVMAQEVQAVMPNAVMRGRDGYLRVDYGKIGVKFQTYQHWIATGAQVPAAVPVSH
jgi:uncharacterized protein DUF3300/endosialidase-like protein